MNVGTADIMEALLPSSNGAIARAFQELESKLSAWTKAVGMANDALATREAALSSACATLDRAADEPKCVVCDDPAVVPESDLSDSTELNESEPASPSSALIETPPAAIADVGSLSASIDGAVFERAAASLEPTAESKPESPAEIESLLAALNPETAEAVRARYEYFKGRKPIRELIQEFEDEADDEESLLMSLEPEVAKAVRVKYRLYNGRKSLREVIAEVEAQVKAPPAAEKKTWWGKRR